VTTNRRIARHFALVALTLGGLYLAGRGLAPPPLAHVSRVPAWWVGQGPVVAVFSAARMAVLIAGVYWLILLGTVAAVGALSPGRLGRSAPGPPLVGVRRAVRLVVSASALGSAVAGGAAPVFAASNPGPGAPTIVNLAGSEPAAVSHPGTRPGPLVPAPPGPSGTGRGAVSTATGAASAPGVAPTTGSGSSRPGPISSDREPQPRNAAPATAAEGGPGVSGGPATAAPADAGGSVPETLATGDGGDGAEAPSEWIVRPGDNLWSIAEQTLAAAWDDSPGDRQVAGYWMTVIAVNRSRLPEPSDPSLLFAGDVILLPPVPSG
jgi:hypothetical protein